MSKDDLKIVIDGLKKELGNKTLVAVSKTKTCDAILKYMI